MRVKILNLTRFNFGSLHPHLEMSQSRKFLRDVNSFVEKERKLNDRVKEPINCLNTFNWEKKGNRYAREKHWLKKIEDGRYSNSKEQGDVLEEISKSLFNRIDLLASFTKTNSDTFLGQIDVSLVPVSDIIYSIWGIADCYPKAIIGECKNYKKTKVSRPEIEKSCWRACKGRALSFFIAPGYKEDAINEISNFNNQRGSIFDQSDGVLIVPVTIGMIKIIVFNDLNFSCFVKWAIKSSKHNMPITNYLSL